MSDQEQAAQDPVQQLEDPEGTRLLVHYQGKRVMVYIERQAEPEIIPGQAFQYVPQFNFLMSCDCGLADCWEKPTIEIRVRFIDIITRHYKGENYIVSERGVGVHGSFVQLMRSVMTMFVQGAN